MDFNLYQKREPDYHFKRWLQALKNKILDRRWLLLLVFSVGIFLFSLSIDNRPEDKIIREEKVLGYSSESEQELVNPSKFGPVPGPISMETLKTKGCVADGFLNGYGDDVDTAIKLINRSPCLYLHRSIETWLTPPDFQMAMSIKNRIEKPNMVFGMFIAEAISKKSKLYYPQEGRYFDFGEMCRKGSENVWGEHTCKPSFEREEYQRYVLYITERAMDIGIQSFMFGQVFFQDSFAMDKTEMPKIISAMQDYARKKGIQIIIGAQTNSISDPAYLKLFDYIEGGVGIDPEGNIENGPCFSGYGGCWALLWHNNYAKKANNVFLHLDWSGIKNDDMSKFARMDQETREKTLRKLYKKFTSQNMGFMMPYFAVLNRENGGCFGPKKRYYSPDNKYGCKDEEAIMNIMSGK